jgi:hypothetical protein
LGLLDEENGAGALDAFFWRAIAPDAMRGHSAPFIGASVLKRHF